VEATELFARADRDRARGLLAGLLAEEPRCLDAYAHLGALAFDYAASLALPHYEAGVALGELSLPENRDGEPPTSSASRIVGRLLSRQGRSSWSRRAVARESYSVQDHDHRQRD